MAWFLPVDVLSRDMNIVRFLFQVLHVNSINCKQSLNEDIRYVLVKKIKNIGNKLEFSINLCGLNPTKAAPVTTYTQSEPNVSDKPYHQPDQAWSSLLFIYIFLQLNLRLRLYVDLYHMYNILIMLLESKQSDNNSCVVFFLPLCIIQHQQLGEKDFFSGGQTKGKSEMKKMDAWMWTANQFWAKKSKLNNVTCSVWICCLCLLEKYAALVGFLAQCQTEKSTGWLIQSF